jgi:hypothetical protein
MVIITKSIIILVISMNHNHVVNIMMIIIIQRFMSVEECNNLAQGCIISVVMVLWRVSG